MKSNYAAISASISLMSMSEQASREMKADWTEEQQAAYAEKQTGKVCLFAIWMIQSNQLDSSPYFPNIHLQQGEAAC